METLLSHHKRPLTVIYRAQKNIPKILLQDNYKVAIRIVQETVIAKTIEMFGYPIVSTSANISDEPIP
ncbi:MAG: Sua5/YciO/YrdC/YwlC family protein [Saprospiraceae bacterium]